MVMPCATLHHRDGMVFIPGGTFRMGSDDHYPEEAPARCVSVDGFWIDATPVTSRQFAEFVKATGYVTAAERPLRGDDYPGVPSQLLQPSSLVFVPPAVEVELNHWEQWWQLVFGANWRAPAGPGSVCGDEHPVVHMTFEDAAAYARWAGKELPTEAEWEFAARGGLDAAEFAWGNDFMPDNHPMANTWHGRFPMHNTKLDGFERTSPVGYFPANGYGLYDMIGNVWEWTLDFYGPHPPDVHSSSCCVPHNPRNTFAEGSYDPCQPTSRVPRRVIKGGSHLCASNYCRRYRPAARQGQMVDSSASHLGFRCVLRGK